jgi:hypothetical protein
LIFLKNYVFREINIDKIIVTLDSNNMPLFSNWEKHHYLLAGGVVFVGVLYFMKQYVGEDAGCDCKIIPTNKKK